LVSMCGEEVAVEEEEDEEEPTVLRKLTLRSVFLSACGVRSRAVLGEDNSVRLCSPEVPRGEAGPATVVSSSDAGWEELNRERERDDR
jgi:hypothetical protein